MNTVHSRGDASGTRGPLVSFVWRNKRWWLIPMLVTLALIGGLIVLSRISTLAPFMYTLF